MTNFSEKITNFIKWLEKSGYGIKDKNNKTIVIPSETYYAEYKMENPEVGDLFNNEKEYLKVKCRNIIFDLVVKGVVPQTAIKTLLAYYCNMSDKVKEQKSEVEKPQVIYQMDAAMDAKPYETPEDLSFENEAIKQIEEEAKGENNI